LKARGDFKTRLVAGQREVAADAARLIGALRGSRVISVTPFFAYYCEGEHVEAADSLSGLEAQVRSGEGDFLYIDSLAAQRENKALRPLVTGTAPVAGAALVYRRYFSDYDRLVSVYQREGKAIALDLDEPEPARVQGLLAQANRYYDEGYYEHARQLLAVVLAADPGNALAHYKLMQICIIYGSFESAFLDQAENHLLRYSFQVPDDPALARYRDLIKEVRIRQAFIWGKD
jgi:hypothetical protein